jgi:hypothetical protein
MSRAQPIVTRPGNKPGEYVVQVPANWELRLRRVLRQLIAQGLPDPREPGISAAQREARIQMRRKHLQAAICQFMSDLVTADIVGKEVALATRNRFGTRRGSLREHVQAILREAGH